MKTYKEKIETKLESSNYLDILFKDRNKDYGAYELRTNYNKRIFTALLCIIIAGSLSTLIAGRGHKPVIPIPRYDTTIIRLARPPAKKIYDKPITKTSKANTNKAGSVKTRSNNFEITNKDIKPNLKDITDTKIGAFDNKIINKDGLENPTGAGLSLGKDTFTNTTLPTNGEGKEKEKETTKETTLNTEFTVDQEPIYPGGNAALDQFLKDNLIYPQSAIEKEQQGKVLVQFVVNEKGSITDVKIAQKAFTEMNVEALRVVKKMPNWKPALVKGPAVSCLFEIPITFALDENP